MNYIIYNEEGKNYLSQTSVPLIFDKRIGRAFMFKNIKAGRSYLVFLRNQGIETSGFHLGQKPPK